MQTVEKSYFINRVDDGNKWSRKITSKMVSKREQCSNAKLLQK